MYTDDNSNKKYTINDNKTMGSKIRQGFKSGNWGIRVIAPLVSDFFVLLSN